MMNLFKAITWLELIRAKSRIFLMLFILLGLGFTLHSCDNMGFDISLHNTMTDNQAHYQKLVGLTPFMGVIFIALIGTFLVLLTIPFRNREEWESGMFQLVAMGNYSFYQVVLCRFIGYLALSFVFFTAIMGILSAFSFHTNVLPKQVVKNFQILVSYWFLALVPIVLAVGTFQSAVNTAYYRDGNKKILTIMTYVGGYATAIAVNRLAMWIVDPFNAVFPPQSLLFQVPKMREFAIHLQWEWPLVATILTAILLLWAGRILEEVEA